MEDTFTIKQLWSACRQTEEMALRKFNLQISAIIASLNMLVIIVDVAREKHSKEPEFLDIAIPHLAKTIVSFESALFAALRTFYSEAANLTRVGLETSWQMFYLFDKPEERSKWLNNEKIQTAVIRKGITASNVPKEMNLYYKIYEELCEVSHPRKKGMDMFFINGNNVKIGPQFEEGYLLQALNHLHLFNGWIRGDLIKRYYPGSLGTVIDQVKGPKFLIEHIRYQHQYSDLFKRVKDRLNELMVYPG